MRSTCWRLTSDASSGAHSPAMPHMRAPSNCPVTPARRCRRFPCLAAWTTGNVSASRVRHSGTRRSAGREELRPSPRAVADGSLPRAPDDHVAPPAPDSSPATRVHRPRCDRAPHDTAPDRCSSSPSPRALTRSEMRVRAGNPCQDYSSARSGRAPRVRRRDRVAPAARRTGSRRSATSTGPRSQEQRAA